MKCSLCDREAFTYIPYARLRLCREHFGEFIRSKVVRAMDRYGMVSSGERILIAVSGGKDSMALLHIMNSISQERSLRVLALHIDLGIGEYSRRSREIVSMIAKSFGIDLIVYDLKRDLGLSLPEMKKGIRRGTCSLCGLVKRYVMNTAAIELGATLATAHNADDIAIYILKNIVIGDWNSCIKLVPVIPEVKGYVAKKIRPLYEVYENEAMLYVVSQNIPYVDMECPYTYRGGIEERVREFLNKLEEERPGIKISFLRKFTRNIEVLRINREEHIGQCTSCGLISSRDMCSFCRITQKIFGEPQGKRVRDFFRSLEMVDTS
ncbi:PP-loop domain protein [Ignisphaera aggregans DSM 17230]|uniref:PP-loop domain protein n=1 Tax=Ignisphaera aggregans (strain DSM 17230 / JCM 13409 / AQ1.S1) TaxID=583356 RepID=E0SS41_IGNAA|nr:PP-loop domain protein [Ignisphaera aggregans DSM 17230]